MRFTRIRFVAALAAALLTAVAPAQEALEPHADIRATYDFEPSTMTFDEQARRAPALGKLWDRFDRNPAAYGPALRAELRAEANRELLYCDGAMLLLAKSSSAEDLELGMQSLRKCSLAEIQHTPYFYTLHALAVRGVDTFELQARILSRPKYSAFILLHALRLGQDYAFLYPFLVQQESTYVPRLITLLQSTSDATAQTSIIRALWYAATPEAEAAVQSAAGDGRLSEAAREEARQLVQSVKTIRGWSERNPTLKSIREAVGVSGTASEDDLRARRRARMHSISDEALHDLEAYTALLYRLGRGT